MFHFTPEQAAITTAATAASADVTDDWYHDGFWGDGNGDDAQDDLFPSDFGNTEHDNNEDDDNDHTNDEITQRDGAGAERRTDSTTTATTNDVAARPRSMPPRFCLAVGSVEYSRSSDDLDLLSNEPYPYDETVVPFPNELFYHLHI